MSFLQKSEFISSSGLKLNWKIECDKLTGADWACIADIICDRFPYFHDVFGVPRGGLKLEKALRPFACRDMPNIPILVVDDVITTGNSLLAMMDRIRPVNPNLPIVGIAAFGRKKIENHPDIHVIWQFWE